MKPSTENYARLTALPAEILLRITTFLPPQALVRLTAVSHTLHGIGRSEHIWRDIVNTIYCEHGTKTEEPERNEGNVPGLVGIERVSDNVWWERASFLLPHAKYLGYFISSRQNTSRVIRISLEYIYVGDADHRELSIVGKQLSPMNLVASLLFRHSEANLIPLPHGARLEPDGQSYSVSNSSPDAGYSIDLFLPDYEWTPLFRIQRHMCALATVASSVALRVKLEPLTRSVILDEDELTEEQIRQRESQHLYALFTGRSMLRRPWLNSNLIGRPSRLYQNERIPGLLRNLPDWSLSRGEEDPEPICSISHLGKKRVDCHGFHLQVRRRLTQLTHDIPMQGGHDPNDPSRRRGVGVNGGPAVLWQGQVVDPDERPGVAMIRAGLQGPNAGGFVFRLANYDTPRQVTLGGADDEIVGEEIVRTDREEFYPIKGPFKQLHDGYYGEPSHRGGEVLAGSLEGFWVGTYGPHGYEFGTISVWLTPIWENSAVGDQLVNMSTVLRPSHSRRFRRELVYVKVTGDANVPSGQISWKCQLPDIDVVAEVAEELANISAAELGTIPSVANEDLLKWSAHNPGDIHAETPRWNQGTLPASGQIANSGFVNPTWTAADITFVRSYRLPSENALADPMMNTEDEDVNAVKESVQEIRLRWRELGKVSIFQRVIV